jgi:uncharacterized protein (DUF1800 family)
MGAPTVSRREFFRTLKINKTSTEENTDPLFEKYSRKTLGPRVYRNELVNYNENNFSRLQDEGDNARVGNITSGLAAFTGTWTVQEALYLSKRIGFGYKKADVDAYVSLGSASAAVTAALTIDNTPPAPPVVWYAGITADANGLPNGADWTQNPFTFVSTAQNLLQQASNNSRNEGLRRWLFGLMLNQDKTIREKLTWFWYHFIPIDFDTVNNAGYSRVPYNSARINYSYFKLLRDNCKGNFKTLIKSICKHPAMMYYLNNQGNTAAAPNENFARELLELFTLGKDPASQYTQSDVVEAAKVITGWKVNDVNLVNPETVYDIPKHKTGNKTFSSFFNNTVITAPTTTATTTNATIDAEFNAFIDMIFSKSTVVSQYICRRLYRYFVYYDIDANIEANVITPLAQTFVANNWEIGPVLKQLFESQHFFDVANKGAYIKSPFDLVVGSARIFNLNYNVSDATNHQAQSQLLGDFNTGICDPMEQRAGEIPSVSGWNAFYQVPAFHQYWINTNTMQKRFAFLTNIFNGYNRTYNTLLTRIEVNLIGFVQQFPNSIIQDPNLLISECVKYLLPVNLNQTDRDNIKLQTLLYQQTTDAYWTTAWNSYLANPANTTNLNIVKTRLKNLLYTIVQLAEYQLM